MLRGAECCCFPSSLFSVSASLICEFFVHFQESKEQKKNPQYTWTPASLRTAITMHSFVVAVCAACVGVLLLGAKASDIVALSKTLRFDPLVPLSHCMTVGEENSFTVEWSLNNAPKQSIEIRYTVAKNKGFSSIGFANENDMQLVTGYPPEDLPCARTLFDTHTVYDLDGNPYPNFPEVPAQEIWNDDYTVKHYVMRNLSITAAHALRDGAALPVNISLLWSYYMSSLYHGSCYGVSTAPFTEAVTYSIDLNDPKYLRNVGQSCVSYNGPNPKPLRAIRRINPARAYLNGEIQQNHRATALLFGGGLLLSTAKSKPLFNGRVLGGEGGNGVCSGSLTGVYGQWYGFSDRVGGIVKYLVSVGTITKPSLYYSAVSTGTNLAFTGAATLTPNVSYIVTVEAFNFAGLSTTVVSKPVTVLNAGKPVFGRMYSGSVVGQNVKYQQDRTTITFTWTNWQTEEHASKNYYTGSYTENGFQYALGITNEDLEAVIPFTSVAQWRNSLTLSGLSLLDGVSYSLTIRSINCATTFTTQTSSGVVIDYSPPLPGFIVVGNSSFKSSPVITKHQHVQGSWWGFRDVLSGIAEYQWAVSTYRRPPSPGTNAYMILPWTSVGLATHAKHTLRVKDDPALNSLAYGTELYLHVKAIDAVGNWVVHSSNSTTLITL